MLCIWWDQNSVIYYEQLKSSETITGERYRLQLTRLKRALAKKILEWKSRYVKVILQHDNARPYVHSVVKNYLEGAN